MLEQEPAVDAVLHLVAAEHKIGSCAGVPRRFTEPAQLETTLRSKVKLRTPRPSTRAISTAMGCKPSVLLATTLWLATPEATCAIRIPQPSWIGRVDVLAVQDHVPPGFDHYAAGSPTAPIISEMLAQEQVVIGCAPGAQLQSVGTALSR